MNFTLVFATHNQHKLSEVRAMLSAEIHLLSLTDIGCTEEIPETAQTLEANALLKATHVCKNYQHACFADDTGLEVEALNGAPGVYSARYAGDACQSAQNIQKLLGNLEGQSNRKARFRTVIALIWNQKEYFFEGIVHGHIALELSGATGFGYDPVFVPDGHHQTFAELGDDIKNSISHRSIAVGKLVQFLETETC